MAYEFIVTLNEAQYARAEAIATKNAERQAKGYKLRGKLQGCTVAQVVVEMFAYADSRLDTLERDAQKEKALRANGVASGVTRRRYEPRHKAVEIADPSQPKQVKEWAAQAPFAG